MLAGGIADLAGHAPTMDAAHALQGAVNAARLLFGVDGAGVMLADPGGRLHWAVASDQVAQLAEDNQEVTVQGPCQVAFAQRRPVHLRDADAERVWGRSPCCMPMVGCGRR